MRRLIATLALTVFSLPAFAGDLQVILTPQECAVVAETAKKFTINRDEYDFTAAENMFVIDNFFSPRNVDPKRRTILANTAVIVDSPVMKDETPTGMYRLVFNACMVNFVPGSTT